jgi:DNA (cytosine-5)-methyltransferase 1
LVGGTPCQSFSVAGLRKGLEDPRGNLALTYVGILDKFRPKWFVWENVPGVLSSNGGRDFGSFLGAVVELGYGFSYRVLDAQYFGVAQRRRRVFVVGHLGDWKPAAEVLFESESLQRHLKPSNKKRERTSYGLKNIAGTLCARDYKGLSTDDLHDGKVIIEPFYCNDLAPTLTSSGAGISRVGNDTTADAQYVVQAIALAENTIGRQPKNGGNGNGFTEDGPMYTLNATGVHGVAYGFEPRIAKREGEPNRFVEEQTPTLRANMGDNQTAVAILGGQHPNAAMGENISPTLTNAMGAGGGHVPIIGQMAVRRLTTVECERLQGFPNNYTKIKDNCPDGPRYKALGNSMAVPVMKWIGERINANKSS